MSGRTPPPLLAWEDVQHLLDCGEPLSQVAMRCGVPTYALVRRMQRRGYPVPPGAPQAPLPDEQHETAEERRRRAQEFSALQVQRALSWAYPERVRRAERPRPERTRRPTALQHEADRKWRGVRERTPEEQEIERVLEGVARCDRCGAWTIGGVCRTPHPSTTDTM